MENNLYLTLFGAITGAIFGSFFNAIALRTVGEQPWWGRERSRCPMCDHILGPLDLVPVFSWICLKGRCRYCLKPIPYRYPLVEIIFSAWGGLAMARWGLSTAGVAASLGGWLMMLNALTDLESGYVYDHLAGAVGLLGLAVRLFGGTSALIDGLWGSVAGGGAIAFIILLSRGGMGWGDATLMAGAGALLGWKMTILGTYSGFMIGGLVAIVMMVMKKAKRKDAVPLAPFLAAGVMVSLIWGPRIMEFWYQTPGWPWM